MRISFNNLVLAPSYNVELRISLSHSISLLCCKAWYSDHKDNVGIIRVKFSRCTHALYFPPTPQSIYGTFPLTTWFTVLIRCDDESFGYGQSNWKVSGVIHSLGVCVLIIYGSCNCQSNCSYNKRVMTSSSQCFR